MMAHNLLQSVSILANGARTFTGGASWTSKRTRPSVHRVGAQPGHLYVPAPAIGYDKAGQFQEAFKTDRTVREVAIQRMCCHPTNWTGCWTAEP